MELQRWQQEILQALESGKLKLLSATELEIRRRAAQREAVRYWHGAWRSASTQQTEVKK